MRTNSVRTLTWGRMRYFRLTDGTSWVARLHDETEDESRRVVGWQAILFETSPAAVAQRLVYRPPGWLSAATPDELAAALEEGISVRVRWGS
jgi:hypothetical protein